MHIQMEIQLQQFLLDPIDNIPDPALYKNVANFTIAQLYPKYPIVSGREMHLIIAENALANGDNATFTAHINKIRALDGLVTILVKLMQQKCLNILEE